MHQLEDGVEQISHSFLAFSSLLLETDVAKRDLRVTLTLRELAQQCLALAKTGCDDLEKRERNSIQSENYLEALEIGGNTAT